MTTVLTPEEQAVRAIELEQQIARLEEEVACLRQDCNRLRRIAAGMVRDGSPGFNDEELQLAIEQGTGRMTNLSAFHVVTG